MCDGISSVPSPPRYLKRRLFSAAAFINTRSLVRRELSGRLVTVTAKMTSRARICTGLVSLFGKRGPVSVQRYAIWNAALI